MMIPKINKIWVLITTILFIIILYLEKEMESYLGDKTEFMFVEVRVALIETSCIYNIRTLFKSFITFNLIVFIK